MDWQQSPASYHFDFYLAPLLGAAACAVALFDPNLHPSFIPGVVLGFVLWTFLEYWTHRLLFHRFMRRAHDLHHERPGGYDAVPPWMTAPIHLALGAVACLSSATLGGFSGMELGYLLYIWTHDQIHHGTARGAWLHKRWQHHLIHHRGLEVNFGVALFWWDRLFGTYRAPSRNGT